MKKDRIRLLAKVYIRIEDAVTHQRKCVSVKTMDYAAVMKLITGLDKK